MQFNKKTSRKTTITLLFLIITFLLYVLILAYNAYADYPTNMRTGQPFPFLSDKPVGEDGFYMLTVAWNMAKGDGIAYNFQKPTSGIQPLFTFILAAIAALVQLLQLDKWFYVRTVLVFGALNLIVFAYLCGVITKRIATLPSKNNFLIYVFPFVIALFNLELFRLFTYGLETGIYLILIQLMVLYSLKIYRDQDRYLKAVVFGALAGITVLARIDFIVIFGVFLLYSLITRQLKIKWTAVAVIVFLIVISPWFLYVYQITGSIFPSSGISQSRLIDITSAIPRVRKMGVALVSYLVPFIYTRPHWLLSIFSLIVLMIISIILIRSKETRERIIIIFKNNRALISWVIGIVVLGGIYLLLFWSVHFYRRYISPLNVVFIPVISVAVINYIDRFGAVIRRFLIAFIPLLFLVWAIVTFHSGAISNTHSITAGYVAENFSEVEKVGALQSGAIGFFNENVENLDGKVNHAATEYLRNGALFQYINQENIEVIVDWEWVIQKFLPQVYENEDWKTCDKPIPNGWSTCVEKSE